MADLLLTAQLKTVAGVRAALGDDGLADELTAVLAAAGHDPERVKPVDGPLTDDEALDLLADIHDVCSLSATGPSVALTRWLGGVLAAHGRRVSGETVHLGAAPDVAAVPVTTVSSPDADARTADLEDRLARTSDELATARSDLAQVTVERDSARRDAEAARQAAADTALENGALREALTDATARITELETEAAARARSEVAEAVGGQMAALVAAVEALADG